MKALIIKRLLILIPMLLVVSLMVSLLMSLAPGDPVSQFEMMPDVDAEYLQRLRQEFGLDQPWYMQYFHWLGQVLPFSYHPDAASFWQRFDFRPNFGFSYYYRTEVWDLLVQRMPATILLSLTSLVLAWVIAIPLGVLAAIYKDSIFDRISQMLAYAALSIPEFFLALLALVFAAKTGWFPIGGFTSVEHDFLSPWGRFLDIAHHLLLPTIVLGIGGVAGVMRIMRANFLDNIRSEYVVTARAKGLAEGAVMFRHVFRNAINPLITAAGFAFSSILSGALLVEIVMNYPGIGQLVYNALLQQDAFVVQASVLMSVIMLMIGNLLADIALAMNDPRIRYD
ncbi:MAG: ABC transporter permease [Chromatiales bacterium]|nr:ABC transporter permease [Chromatiales bacterium]